MGVVKIEVHCIWEHNGNDSLIYADNFIGAFTRGASKDEALYKMNTEIMSYLLWRDGMLPIHDKTVEVMIVQEKISTLQIADADSDVLFESERQPLTKNEYEALKKLAIKSAQDFQLLFEAIPNKNLTSLPERKTFYGQVPITAQQMYDHTIGVNNYYFGEIGIDTDNNGNIVECRKRSFEQLESIQNYLNNKLFIGSYEEEWTLRKVCRRFIWHDRIHAKAMFRMACTTFGKETIPNIFSFSV